MRHLSHKDFHWGRDNNLMFQERAVCSLIPHEAVPKHYYLKFEWRDHKTPEFFNKTNARENARVYCLRHYQNELGEAHTEV